MIDARQNTRNEPGARSGNRAVGWLVAACLGLAAAGAPAQDAIPPVPPGDLGDLEIPIWEDANPDLRGIIHGPDAVGEDDAATPAEAPPSAAVEAYPLDEVGPIRPEIEPGPAEFGGEPPLAAAGAAPSPLPDTAVSDAVVAVEPPAASEPHESKRTFRVGLVPRGEQRAYVARLEPMRQELTQALDRPVELLPLSSLSALVDAQVLGRVDLAFYSASAHVTADRLCRCVEPLVAPVAADGTAVIHAVIVVRRDSGFNSVDDLQGRTVAAAAAGSIGGRLYQLVSLKEEGIDPKSHFAAVEDVGSSAEAVLAVRDGIVDAAFAWTTLAGDADAGYSRGTFAFLVSAGQIDMDDLSIVWQSRPLAHGPVSVLAGMAEGDKAVVESFLTGLSARDPESYDLLEPYYGGGYQPVEPADYRGARLLTEIDVRGLVRSPAQPRPRVRPLTPIQTIGEPANDPPDPGHRAAAPHMTGSVDLMRPPAD